MLMGALTLITTLPQILCHQNVRMLTMEPKAGHWEVDLKVLMKKASQQLRNARV